MSKDEVCELTFEKLDGNWSTNPEDLKAEIQEFANEHDADCEFWFENAGALLFDCDDEEDVEIPFEIIKSGACTYIVELSL